jgi:CO/xanthine dehydrogenase Mo-binding subunit
MTYTATARRDGRWWVVQCDQHPSALSQVARLDQAADVHREAIAFVTGVPEDEVEVEVRPMLDSELSSELDQAAQLAEQAKRAEEQAGAKRRRVARRLAKSGMTVRDVGAVMGVSYQRAHQLVKN